MIEDGHVLDIPSNQRLDKAVHFYEKSAKRGNTDAMTDLGFLNEKGIVGTEESSLVQAVEHYKQAIEGHNPRAMNNLAGFYLAGRRLFRINFRTYGREFWRSKRTRSL